MRRLNERTDNQLHALSYTFSTPAGRFENRPELLRTNSVTGIQAPGAQLSPFPNTTNGNIQLSGPGISQISRFDARGLAVLQTEITGLGNLNLSNLYSGVYTLRCINKGQSSVHKVVKQ
ncbi:MAG: T9SS type A sorting domain-containing protein [Bacteroidota bacterium]